MKFVQSTPLLMRSKSHNLASYLKPYRWTITAGIAFVAGSIGIGVLAIPKLNGRIIDGLEQQAFDWRGLSVLVAMFLGSAVLGTLFSILMRRLLLGMSRRVEHDIRRDTFARLTELDTAYFHKEYTGDIMTRMTSDLNSVREFIGQGCLQGARIALGFPIALTVMFLENVLLALTILAIIPVISIVFFFVIRMVRSRYDAVQEQFSVITTYCQEMFGGFRTIKGFGIETRARSRFRMLNEEFIRRNMALTRIEEPVWPFMMLMFGVSTLLLLLVGGTLIIRERITIGTLIEFNYYMFFLQWPMLALGWTSNMIQRGLASWKRIRAIMDAEPNIKDGAMTDPSIDQADGDIVFNDVSLHIDGADLLHPFSLTIPRGQCVAITGPTGSGKTLLVSLIMRLMDPTSGQVSIGGRDLRTIPLKTLRQSIGVAPQEPFLFSDTLANNIAFGLPAENPDSMAMHGEKINWASTVAHLHEDVEGFPRKYETLVGERGVTLSGGQRQRTAIGRALAVQPNILILDDVFSAVDTQTEAAILRQLLPVLRGRTSILISHRVSTLKHADRILVMEDGRIVEDGTHGELVRQDGYYRELDEMQRLEARLEEDPA